MVFWLRLRRDLPKKRKPPLILLRRGLALWRAQPALKRKALAAGFTPMSMRRGGRPPPALGSHPVPRLTPRRPLSRPLAPSPARHMPPPVPHAPSRPTRELVVGSGTLALANVVSYVGLQR